MPDWFRNGYCGNWIVNSTAGANKAGLFAPAARLMGGPRP
jgi:hypothetical protein